MRAERILFILAGVTLIVGGLLIGLNLATVGADVPKGQPTVIQLVDGQSKAVKASMPIILHLFSKVSACKRKTFSNQCETIPVSHTRIVYTDSKGRYSVSNRSFLPASTTDYKKIIARDFKNRFGKDISKDESDFFSWVRSTLSKKSTFTPDDIWKTIETNSKSSNYQLSRPLGDYSPYVVVIEQTAGLGSLAKADVFTFKSISNLPALLEATGGLADYEANLSNFDLKFDSTNYRQSLNLAIPSTVSNPNCQQ